MGGGDGILEESVPPVLVLTGLETAGAPFIASSDELLPLSKRESEVPDFRKNLLRIFLPLVFLYLCDYVDYVTRCLLLINTYFVSLTSTGSLSSFSFSTLD